ncbi:hypothetical protein C3L33_10850, partial [Rhododendron williamsianum]
MGGKDEDEDSGDIVSGLQCKIVVQFENYKDFHTALKVLSGRSLQKQGSRLKADYEVTWDKDGFFRNTRNETEDKSIRMPPLGAGNYRSEAYRRQSHFSRYSPDNERTKRFKSAQAWNKLKKLGLSLACRFSSWLELISIELDFTQNSGVSTLLEVIGMQHLVGGYRNAKACRQCLSEVKEEMRQYFLKKNEEKDQVNSIPDFDDVMNNDIVCLLLLPRKHLHGYSV